MPVAACPSCGYDTKGLPSAVCPECGTNLPDVEPPWVPGVLSRSACATLMIVAAIGLAYVVTVPPGFPRWWAPLPLTVVLPYVLSESVVLAFLPVALAAALLSVPLVLGCYRIPWSAAVPVLGINAFSWLHFITALQYGVEYQGTAYVVVCGSINAVTSAALAAIWVVNYQAHKFWLVVAWHAIAALWLASYAFPYYGELP